MFEPTWEEVITPSILVNAFLKSGISPLSTKQVAREVLNSSEPSDKEPADQPMSITKNLVQCKPLMPLKPHCPLLQKQSTAAEWKKTTIWMGAPPLQNAHIAIKVK